MAQVILKVPDISCEHCVHTVTQALQPLHGVRSVRVDIPTQKVRVEYDEGQVDVERMKEVLEEEEYPVASVEAAGPASASA
jgi:copper chaperone